MPVKSFPPFPQDVPTHPLLVIDYELIKSRDETEINHLWEAGKKLGFWYLKNHGAHDEADGMFDIGPETMDLPFEEKMKFEQGDEGLSFGYKTPGANVIDSSGQLDTPEFVNVAKDDAFAWPKQARRDYPSTIKARMYSAVVPFVKKSVEIHNTILDVFSEKLGLPPNTLLNLHSTEEFSGTEARIIKNPATLDPRQAIVSHTDFGSLAFIHNRLGGLQVLVPGAESWQYVKPVPGYAVCNIGDALSIFSGGILRSNLHRVLPPPGLQTGLERWSIIFLTRPGDSVILRALVDESPIIAEAVAKNPAKSWDTGSTSLEWFTRRVKNHRIKNRKGPETWKAARGTEDIIET